MHFSGFQNFQEQEKFIQEVFRFADNRNLDVDALVAQAAAYRATTPEEAAVVITVAYLEKWTNKTLAQNHRDIAPVVFAPRWGDSLRADLNADGLFQRRRASK